MISSAIYCRIAALSEDISFVEAEEMAKKMAASPRIDETVLEARDWNGKLYTWRAPTYMTFGEAEWVPRMAPQTLAFRKAFGILVRDGYSPLTVTISPLPVMTRSLTSSIPRYLEDVTGKIVSLSSVSLRLEHLLSKPPGDLLRYEWVPHEGAVAALSATADHLPLPPRDFVAEHREVFTALTMKWRGLNVTLRRDFSLEIANIEAPFERVAREIADLVPTLAELQVLDMEALARELQNA